MFRGFLRFALPAVLLLPGTCLLEGAEPAKPEWIWVGAEAKDNELARFRRGFEVDGPPARAWLMVTCDNFCDVHLNGVLVTSVADWTRPVRLEVTDRIQAGANILAIEAGNESGPAGLLCVLEWSSEGTTRRLVSDDRWRVSPVDGARAQWTAVDFADDSWRQAHSVGELGQAPWTTIDRQRLEAAASGPTPLTAEDVRLTVPDGFEGELVYTVPRRFGSWVAITFDPEGRIIASDQYGSLYRVTLRTGAPSVEPIPLAVGSAQGLLHAFGALYVIGKGPGTGSGTGLLRLRDTDGDDQYDEVELLRLLSTRSGGEHDVHAVVLGPDGESLFVMAGNHIPPLEKYDRSRVPLVWDEDHLLPRMQDPSGHAATIRAPGGWIARTDREGREWELVANGFRNAYDFAFDRRGELFTFDSDMEYDMGLPWYRPTRVLHVTSGAEFGWRTGTSKWPQYFPDSLPAVVDVGPSSPTGVAFGYGTRFPAPYRDALFIQDWAYGIIYAVHLTPRGASYAGRFEKFVTGEPLALTDMAVGPDGALYFTVGGRRTRSALYRVRYGDPDAQRDAKGTETPPAEVTELPSMAMRRRLEREHEGGNDETVENVWPALAHSDRFIRYAARIALEHRPVEEWRSRALAEEDRRAALAALLALSRHESPEKSPAIQSALLKLRWSDLDEPERLELLRVHALVLCRGGAPAARARPQLLSRFEPLYPAPSTDLNRELCRLLVYLESPVVVPRTMPLLEGASSQEEQIQYALFLRLAPTGWTPDLARRFHSWLARAARLSGGASFGAYLRNIRAEALSVLSLEERRGLVEITGEAGLEAEPEETPNATGPGREWTLAELLPLVRRGLHGRDFQQGKKMFAAALCSSCHRVAGRGGAIGQDLTGVASRFGVEDLLRDILDPSREISDRYRPVVLTLRDGTTVEGRIVREEAGVLQVMTDVFDPSATTTVARKDVRSQEDSDVSDMPEGLLDDLNPQEVLDLMAYLLSRGEPSHRYFRR